MTFLGTILTGAWSIGVVCVNYIKDHEFNAIATISAVFAGSGLIGTIVLINPNFCKISPIVQDILYAASTAYGNISSPLMLAFSIMFPKWYYKRVK